MKRMRLIQNVCVCVPKRVTFSPLDLGNLVLQLGNTFHNVYEFKKTIKQANVLKENDLHFKKKKNTRKKHVAVCSDKKYKYRGYGRQLKDGSTFMLISLRPRHTCIRTRIT
jgi:hypothetical protein